jgi:hypothetical protein
MEVIMDSFRRGFAFLQQSWRMALADRDLLKPTLLSLLAGFLVTLIGSVPIVLAFVVFGESNLGQVVGGVLGVVLVFVQYTVTYIFSAMTIYLIFGYLSEGDGRMDRAWEIVRRDMLDIMSLALASTLVNLVKNAVKGKGRSGARNFLANLINTVWTEATYLILPIMVIENLNLKDALKRATYIARNNLLLIGISTVGVGFVTGLIGFILGAVGIALGLGVSFGLVSLAGSPEASPWLFFGGITLGVIIAALFILAAVIIGGYTTTAYHTCLYLWARDVEKAQRTGQSGQAIQPPAPLAQVLR